MLLPSCQDTGTAIVMGKRGQQVRTHYSRTCIFILFSARLKHMIEHVMQTSMMKILIVSSLYVSNVKLVAQAVLRSHLLFLALANPPL